MKILLRYREMGRTGLLVYAAVAAAVLLLSLAGCDRLLLFDDYVTYGGGSQESSGAVCYVEPVDGVLYVDGAVRTAPRLLLTVTSGANLIYEAVWSVDGGPVSRLGDIRLRQEYVLDCSGCVTEGGHTVTGTVSAGAGRTVFTASYTVTREGDDHVTYSDPVVTVVSVDDIPACGGTVSSAVVTYAQTMTVTRDGSSETRVLTEGGTVTFGSPLSAPSLGDTLRGRTLAGYLDVTVRMNGRRGTAAAAVYRQANVLEKAEIATERDCIQVWSDYGDVEYDKLHLRCTGTYTSGVTATVHPSYSVSDPDLVSISDTVMTAVEAKSFGGTPFTVNAVSGGRTVGSRSLVIRPEYLGLTYSDQENGRFYHCEYWDGDTPRSTRYPYRLQCAYRLRTDAGTLYTDVTRTAQTYSVNPAGNIDFVNGYVTFARVWDESKTGPVEVTFCYPREERKSYESATATVIVTTFGEN